MRSRRPAVLWAAAGAYAAAIFILSSMPVPSPAVEPMAVVGDKGLHVIEYIVFALLLALAIAGAPSPRVRRRAGLLALLGAALYAATDEIHQTFVPGRQADLMDMVADVAGAAIAAALYEAWRWRASRLAPVSETSPR